MEARIPEAQFGPIAIKLSGSTVLPGKVEMICGKLVIDVPSAKDSPYVRFHRILCLTQSKYGCSASWKRMTDTLRTPGIELNDEADQLEEICRNTVATAVQRQTVVNVNVQDERDLREPLLPPTSKELLSQEVKLGEPSLPNALPVTASWLTTINKKKLVVVLVLSCIIVILIAAWAIDRSNYTGDDESSDKCQPVPHPTVSSSTSTKAPGISITTRTNTTKFTPDDIFVSLVSAAPPTILPTTTKITNIPRKTKPKTFDVPRLSLLSARNCDDWEGTLRLQEGTLRRLQEETPTETLTNGTQNCTSADGNVPNFILTITGTTKLDNLYSNLCQVGSFVTSIIFFSLEVKQDNPPKTCSLPKSCSIEFPYMEFIKLVHLTVLDSECITELLSMLDIPTLKRFDLSCMDIVTSNVEFIQALILNTAPTLTELHLGRNATSYDSVPALITNEVAEKLLPTFKIVVDNNATWTSSVVNNVRNHTNAAKFLIQAF